MTHAKEQTLRGNLPVIRIVLMLFCLLCTTPAHADVLDGPCQRYSVPKVLALAIMKQESDGNPWCVNVEGRDFHARSKEEALDVIRRNSNRSYDVGLMQVNSWWLRHLGITPEAAIDPANNVQLGLWILASEIRRHGLSWKAVGAYHSPNPIRQASYARLIARHLRNIMNHEK